MIRTDDRTLEETPDVLNGEEKVKELNIPNFGACISKILEDAFEEVRHEEFPSLVEQFPNAPKAREIIDRAALRTIGYEDKEIDRLLPELYEAMAVELKSWVELMHQMGTKGKAESWQLHLLPEE